MPRNAYLSVSEYPQQGGVRETSNVPRQALRFKKALVLDGYSTRTLAIVRSWGKRGIPFAVGGESRLDMSLFSRFAAEKFIYTSPKEDVSKFVRDMNRICAERSADAIFPTSEAAIMACNEHRNDLAAVPIIPGDADIKTAFSKAATSEIARSVGIDIPATVRIEAANDPKLANLDFPFPIVVKSDASQVRVGSRTLIARKTAYISNHPELLRECESRLAQGDAVLLQQFIDGYGVGVSGLFNRGEPVALLAHRRIRESDPLGGPSALAETVELEPRLREASIAIMRKIGFTGPAMVEYKVDRRTGTPFFLEINGRFWGTVLLAPAAGLDLPYLYWKLINDLPIQPEESTYRVGVRGRYLAGDAKNLLLCLKGRPRNWPGQFTSRWTALKSFAASFVDPRTKELIFESNDPLPFFARLIQDFA